jgi:hypothetical protein
MFFVVFFLLAALDSSKCWVVVFTIVQCLDMTVISPPAGYVLQGTYPDGTCSASTRVVGFYKPTAGCQTVSSNSIAVTCASGSPVQQSFNNPTCSGTPVSSTPLSTSCVAEQGSTSYSKYECAVVLPTQYLASSSVYSSSTCTGTPFQVVFQGTASCSPVPGIPGIPAYAGCSYSGANMTLSMCEISFFICH